jgi:GH24 family phage-related lysozyme (muramidase)
MTYDNYTYNPNSRSASTPRWYSKNPVIDAPSSSETYIGYVRESRDPQNMGRLLVWIPELTGDGNKEDNWILCHYCSPFGGASFPRKKFYEDEDGSDAVKFMKEQSKNRTPDNIVDVYGGRQSYGMWFSPPDIGNEVLITFVNGDANFAVWFGVLFQQDMNHMIPGIAENTIYDENTDKITRERGPVIEPDYTSDKTVSSTGSNPYKIKYTPLYNGLKYEQGLHDDKVRGQSSSSARRESPSEVFGILTPDGNQFVMDDLETQELIRLRTKSGAQLLINQTDGMIYAISRDGNTWIELSNEGNIDIYGSENISIHAEHANVNVKSGQDINLQATRDINMRAGRNFKIDVVGNFDVQGAQNIAINSTQKMSIGAGTDIGISSSQTIGITSSSTTSINGSQVFFNGRAGQSATPSIIPETYTPSGPSTSEGDEKPWVSGSPYNATENIIPRVPQHEPWIEHQISTNGTNNNVAEGPLNPDIPLGGTTENATKPNDITLPNGNRLEGDSYTPSKTPQYNQIDDVPDCALSPMATRQISQAGLDHIKQAEGVKNTIYKDQAGKDTIGVGHLITAEESASGRFSSGTITDSEIDTLLLEDIDKTQRGVRGCVTQPVTQEQYDAMTSLAFNIGTGNFCNSTLVKKINSGDYKEVPNQMLRWNKIKQGSSFIESAGLTTRRRSEANLFAKTPSICV